MESLNAIDPGLLTLRMKGPLSMSNKRHKVVFKELLIGPQLVFASSSQIHGEHLIFLDADNKLAALFLIDAIESWSPAAPETG
jgi:hypothetical protein